MADIIEETAFDIILKNKMCELQELYKLKIKKKLIPNVNEINFMDKQLFNKINAANEKKIKESKNYKKKCESDLYNAMQT